MNKEFFKFRAKYIKERSKEFYATLSPVHRYRLAFREFKEGWFQTGDFYNRQRRLKGIPLFNDYEADLIWDMLTKDHGFGYLIMKMRNPEMDLCSL